MLLNNRYAVEDPIDRTATATICRGRDTLTDHVVAIKVLRDVYSSDAKFVMRFQQAFCVRMLIEEVFQCLSTTHCL